MLAPPRRGPHTAEEWRLVYEVIAESVRLQEEEQAEFESDFSAREHIVGLAYVVGAFALLVAFSCTATALGFRFRC